METNDAERALLAAYRQVETGLRTCRSVPKAVDGPLVHLTLTESQKEMNRINAAILESVLNILKEEYPRLRELLRQDEEDDE